MHITRLEIENFKRIVAVDITPDENMVVISGANDQGKSSILDAIHAALKAREIKKNIPQPVRHGEEKSVIKIDVQEYIVTRTFSANGTNKLKVETPAGESVRNPQAVLDHIVGALSLDPLRFIYAEPKDQVKQLTDAFNVDLSVFDATRKKLAADRLVEKKHKQRLETQISNIAPPSEIDPTEEKSISDLMERLGRARVAAQEEKTRLERIACITREMEDLKRELATLEAKAPLGNVDTQVVELESEAANIEKHNKRAREVKQYNDIRQQITEVDSAINGFNDKIELNDINKLDAVESIDLPVSGLDIEPEGLLFDGVPFSQLSQSKQIQIAMAVVMAANPKLRVIRITQGSLIDENNMKIIETMAREGNFQVWIEMVDTSGTVGICIEEGEIKHGDAGRVEPD